MEYIKGDKCFESLDQSQHLLFYFGAGWCGPCKEAGPKFEELAKKYPSDKIKFLKVDMDEEENKEFIQANQVQNIPTFILYKDRNFLDRVIGGDFDTIKHLIKKHSNLDHPDGNGVNKKINGVQPPPQPPQQPQPQQPQQPQQPKLEEFYPSEKFQGGFEHYEYKNGDKGLGYYLQKDSVMNPPLGSGSGGSGSGGSGSGGSGTGGSGDLEVHMVYGAWCGHSKRALPDFEELVKETGVKTSSGSSVKFVLTDDKSDGMEKFKGKVRGFPTYMVVKPDDTMDELKGHDRSKDSIVNAVKALTY